MAVILLMAATLLKWVLVLMTLPLLLELLCLTVGSLFYTSLADEEDSASELPSLGRVKRLMVIVPSHNEELSIARCVSSITAATGSGQDILVVAHNCTDNTAEIAARAGARVEVVNDLTRRGKGHALKHGFEYAFAHCGAEAVMIVDADSTVSENIVSEVKKRLADSPVVQCRYQVKNYSETWRTRLTSLAFLGINVIRARGRDSLGLSCGIFGNGFAMRKEVLERVEYDAHSIVEDMEFHLALVDHGYQVRFINDACVLGDMPLLADTSASQHSRWEGGRIRLLSDWGMRLFRKVLQGKFRMSEPLVDLLSLPLALEIFSLLILMLYPSMVTRVYVASACSIILLHIAVVIAASPDRLGSLRTLLLSPVYLVWRLTMVTSAVRASSKGATWVRTARDASVDIGSRELLAAKAVNGSQETS
jgi:cellulose synthase/poly-beta-1,6-N-acetylglucosamine synthase-like glycosyltransferase